MAFVARAAATAASAVSAEIASTRLLRRELRKTVFAARKGFFNHEDLSFNPAALA